MAESRLALLRFSLLNYYPKKDSASWIIAYTPRKPLKRATSGFFLESSISNIEKEPVYITAPW